jgi:tetratricopeptide (TPR) repeat protein
MDFYDFQSLLEYSDDKNNIYLDDVPVDSLLYRDIAGQKPTPADLAFLWSEGYVLTETMKKALVTILINKISIAFNLNRVKEAELIITNELEKVKDNPKECIKSLIALIRLNEKLDPEEAKMYYTKTKLLLSQNGDIMDESTKCYWNTLKGSGNLEVNPYLLRTKALEMLEKQQYSEAEKIYREMIELDFDMPGTLCHLARVQLLSGQEKEAEKSVKKAWNLRGSASKYVVPRIIFLKILFLMFRNQNPSFWIDRITIELQNADSCLEWHIKPLLESNKSRLTSENFVFISQLAEAVQDKEKYKEFEQFVIMKHANSIKL